MESNETLQPQAAPAEELNETVVEVQQDAVADSAPTAEEPSVSAESPAAEAEAEPEASLPQAEEQIPVETAADFITYLRNLVETENPEKGRVEAIKSAFYKHQHQEIDLAKKMFEEAGNALEEFNIEPYNILETEFRSILNLWREKRSEQIAQAEKVKQDNLVRKTAIIESIHALNENSEDIHKSLSEVRRLQQEWKETGPVPQEQVNELWKKYQAEVEKFYDQLRLYNEFRDYDSKKNLEAQTALCETAEKLAEEGDVVIAFRKLQELHEQWRETGPVAKEIREEIWQRFKNASTEINKKYQAFFERLKVIESENLAQKTAVCETLEAIELDKLTSFKLWDKKTAEVIELQERWKTIGFAPKKSNNKVFERYRAACDRFFQAKSEFYKSTKDTLNANLEKKKALCEQAEALKDSTAWTATANQFIQLQKEWKAIGPVPRKVSDALWKRFIAACDYFFEQKEKNVSPQRAAELQNLAAKKSLLEEVQAFAEQLEGEEALNKVREFNARWNEIGHVPFREKDKIYARWREAVDALAERLNVDRATRRLNSFKNNLDDLKTRGQNSVRSEKDRLMRQYETICNEIKTCENNIGFFTMSAKSKGAGLLDEMHRNIDKLREERDLLLKKIKMMDEEQQ